MPMFRDRERSFEAKFAHDEEVKFKARARCNALVGHWAAGKLGLAGAAADAYAKDLVSSLLESATTDDLFKRVRADFIAGGVAQSDHRIHRTIDEFMARAFAEISAGE